MCQPGVTPFEAALLAELRAIRALLERRDRGHPQSLSREDVDLLRRILPATAGVRGSERLTSWDLVEDDAPAIRLAVGQMTAKQIGKLFARAAGIAVDGFMVRRVGVECHATAWQIVGC
jgi:hypothetical protein